MPVGTSRCTTRSLGRRGARRGRGGPSKGRKAITLEADLGDPAAAQGLVATAVGRLGPLGLLVNNASTHEKDSLATLTLKSRPPPGGHQPDRPGVSDQAFARQQPVPEGASIVNLLDQQITAPSPAWFSYFVAKIGLEGATRLAAFELAPDIRVNAVAPGLVLPSAGQTPEAFEERQGSCRSSPGWGPATLPMPSLISRPPGM